MVMVFNLEVLNITGPNGDLVRPDNVALGRRGANVHFDTPIVGGVHHCQCAVPLLLLLAN